MKKLKVKDLIKLLESVDQNLLLSVEGCDCEAYAIGISKVENDIVIRRESGVFDDEKLIVLKKD